MKVNRGDVVIIEHAFSDATGAKVRPALVVQGDRRNAALSNTVLAMITKNVSRAGTDPTQLLIDVRTPEGGCRG